MSVTIHTSHGNIKIELNCELVPKASKNFLALCANGYYNGTIFHRNIKQFILQGGDPTGTGRGGQSIYEKNFNDEIIPELKHDRRGIVSMANSGPNQNGSQFFITYQKQTHLNNVYTVFGKVIDGWDTLELIEKEPTDIQDRPLNEIKIFTVSIHSNPIAENEQA